MNLKPRHALTMGGLDPITGAGVYSDVKTMSMLKVLPLAVATCIVLQNSSGVKGVRALSGDDVSEQLKCVLEDCRPSAIKISVVYNEDVISRVLPLIPDDTPIVLDPVIRSWDGYKLITDGALKMLEDELIPRTLVVTPNALEASQLTGVAVKDLNSAKEAAKRLSDLGARNVVIKGGHLSSSDRAYDLLYSEGEFYVFDKPKVYGERYHGLGCAFAASLTSFIAHGFDVVKSVELASKFTGYALRGAYRLKGSALISNPLQLYFKSLDVVNVLDSMIEALTIVESTRELVELTPEVGMNIAMTLLNPETLEDICGIEGRLKPIRGFLRASGHVKFGGSEHLGNLLLEVNKVWPTIRACINIRYSDEALNAIKSLGLRASSFDRRKEPPNIKAVEGQSMKWGAREALRGLKEPPDVIYDLGDVGKEPMIRILGENAVDVVRKAVKIAGKVKELKNTS